MLTAVCGVPGGAEAEGSMNSADGSGAQDGQQQRLIQGIRKKLARTGSLMEDDFVLSLRLEQISTAFQRAACNRFNINHLKNNKFQQASIRVKNLDRD
jgi:hypothetical protein